MLAISSLVLVIITTPLFLQPVFAVRCFDCDGADCQKGYCYGSYCVVFTFKPKFSLGEEIVAKGCLSGNMLKRNIPDQCETLDETAGNLRTCFCSSSDFCNGKIDWKKTVMDKIKLINCHCDHCGSSSHCLGEFCKIDIDKRTGRATQGCANTTAAPILSRGVINSCSQPSVTERMHDYKHFDIEKYMHTENCLCNEFQFCNFRTPVDLNRRRMKCPLDLNVEIPGLEVNLGKKDTCNGEYCIEVTLNNSENAGRQVKFMRLRGCTTRRKLYLVEELHEHGCIITKAGNRKLKVCFKTPEDMKKMSNQMTETDEKSVTSPGHAGSGLNTGIVLFFLFLILLILVAGGVLKLDLHKKLFSAKYQSVAG